MATINRKSFSSIVPVEQQLGMAKVIVANITPTGYLRIVTVRTKFVNEQPIEEFMDIMVHPDRAMDIDVQKFDAISVQGTSPRNAPGQAKANTQYLWANGVTAVGRHLVQKQDITNEQTGEVETKNCYAGVGIYATASLPETAAE